MKCDEAISKFNFQVRMEDRVTSYVPMYRGSEESQQIVFVENPRSSFGLIANAVSRLKIVRGGLGGRKLDILELVLRET